MSDLIERLRMHKPHFGVVTSSITTEEAADKIESQAAEIERLTVALITSNVKHSGLIIKFHKDSAEWGVNSLHQVGLLQKRIAELESDDHEWYLQAKRIEKLERALKSIVGQTDDQMLDGVWREVNTTALAAIADMEQT